MSKEIKDLDSKLAFVSEQLTKMESLMAQHAKVEAEMEKMLDEIGEQMDAVSRETLATCTELVHFYDAYNTDAPPFVYRMFDCC